jgi:hypothetical protein
MRKVLTRYWVSITAPVFFWSASLATASAVELVGRAVLPATTFAPGPTSGQLITSANGQTPPFFFKQPVQGFSAVLPGPRLGTFLVMVDNGFGAKANSPDALLRVYAVQPDFKTRQGGSGQVFAADVDTGEPLSVGFSADSFVQLHDGSTQAGFPIVAEQPTYPATTIAVDPQIQAGRQLTGGDFALESFRRAKDGTFWFGDDPASQHSWVRRTTPSSVAR